MGRCREQGGTQLLALAKTNTCGVKTSKSAGGLLVSSVANLLGSYSEQVTGNRRLSCSVADTGSLGSFSLFPALSILSGLLMSVWSETEVNPRAVP